MSEMLSRVVTMTAGMLYPAYRSYKAVRTKDVREYVKWMMYWIVFALYCNVETFADVFLGFWFPMYYYLKMLLVFWLLSPWTKGASILYRKWVHPMLAKYENDIDAYLDSAKAESYNQVMRIGSRTLLCARDIVAEAALRGQQQLVNQLQKSYSMNDVSNVGVEKMEKRKALKGEDDLHIQEVEEQEGSDADYQPEEELEDPEPPRRRRGSRSRSRPLEGGENAYSTMPRRNPRRH